MHDHGTIIILDGRWEISHRQLSFIEWWDVKMPRDMSSFSLGFDGEEWFSEHNFLMIPVPNTDKSVLVARTWDDEFSVITQDKWEPVGGILMAASYIQHFLDTYVTTGGNLEEQANTEA